MASTIFGVNDALAVQTWSKRLMIETLKATMADKFVGSGPDSCIQIKDELNSAPGYRITYGLRMQLSGAGVLGDATLTGQEESLTRYNDFLIIDQLRHAVDVTGVMSQQRVTFDIRAEAKSGLVDWWSNRMDVCLLNQLAGNAAQTDNRFTGLQGVAPTAPSSTRALYGGGVAGESSLSSAAQKFTLDLIDKAVLKARTLSPAIRPVKVGGMSCYVLLIHPNQALDLRTNMSTGQWVDFQRAAMQGGMITKNPIFTGATGMYNGVIIHEDARVPFGDSTQGNATYKTDLGAAATGTTSVARAIFMGAQSAVIAFGRMSDWPLKMKWVEVLKDYENALGVSAAMVFGCKKVIFNSVDFGTITISTYSPGA